MDDQGNKTSQELRVEDHVLPIFLTYHHTVIILVAYLLFVKFIGPAMMSKRKPLELDNIIRTYNISQIVMNVYIIYYMCSSTGIGILNPLRVCDVVSSAMEDKSLAKIRVLECLYYYYINKIIDLMDTVFFVLRKKQSQVTFLHVYHHVVMVGSLWVSTMMFRDEILISFAALNCLIHVVMYTYYLLSSFGPAIQKYLWWKKYITSFQIGQFVLDLAMLLKLKFSDCEHTSATLYLWTFNLSTILMLFIDFYIKSYSHKKKVK
ncbi:very long chain fatty acid elongase 7 [Halyomorpha halys]|uniref:very long chain fatty acid elongase 7 n=1 Tax=Halyomorpha halys TaxID=286706 RepID=UPI0006D4EFC5|nr:elongation of very long chain fatty acids protein 7-like [Halyomorpha halys]